MVRLKVPSVGPVQPSSLLFVAVVAIWAAFLVQHWVRRREAMTTARSVDRFSEAMHLLDRRPVLASSEARPPADMIAAGTAPPSQHRVVPLSPLVARGRDTTVAAAASSNPATPARPGRSTGVSRAAATAAPDDWQGSRQHRHAGPRHRSRPATRWARVVFLLVALGSVPVTIVLAAFTSVPWAGVGVAVAVVLIAVFMLRYAVVRERTRRRFDRSIAASSQTGHHPVTAGAPVTSEPRPFASSPADGIPANGAPAPTTAARDTTAAAASRGERAASRSGLDGPTWSPVPVPPPAYALKAQVARHEPVTTPVPTAGVVSTGAAGNEAQPQPKAGEQAARRAVGD